MESLFKEQVRQGSGNIAAIPKQLAAQSFDHARNRSPIIDVAWSQTTSQQIAPVIDRQVQFKPEEPAHACFATPSIHRKDAMPTDAFGITDRKRSRINEADPRTGSISALQIGQHRKHHVWNEGHKALITYQAREFLPQMHLHIFRVIRFERSVVRLMKVDQNRHHRDAGRVGLHALAAGQTALDGLSNVAQSRAKNRRQNRTTRGDSES